MTGIPSTSVENNPCIKCSLDCSNETSLSCRDCKLWIHYECTALPIYQLLIFSNTSRAFSCENCAKNICKDYEKQFRILKNKLDILKQQNDREKQILDSDKDNELKNNHNENNIKVNSKKNKGNNIKNKNNRKKDDTNKIFVVGDSMSRHLSENLRNKTGKDATGYTLSGGTIVNAVQTLRNSSETHDTLVVQVGTNDIGRLKEDDIKFKYRALLDEMKNRRLGSVLIGILPRGTVYKEEPFRNNDAFYINKWLENECNIRNIKFLDQWDIFYGNWSMYGRDGFHLSKLGKNKLAQNLVKLLQENNFLG